MNTASKRIAIVTDAYFPQISGVATTIKATVHELEKQGHKTLVIAPKDFRFTIPMPGYSEIKLAFFANRALARMLNEFKPDHIHISVEGPLGRAAKRYCKKRKLKFSTAYHTRFPEYVQVRTGIPLSISYAVMRQFHNGAKVVMVASQKLRDELERWGFKNIALWTRGVDTDLFKPDDKESLEGDGPIFMYMGRVAVEKNLRAFLDLDLPGTKYVVGDGPARVFLEKKYPEAVFTGYKFGKELARHLAAADVFVFPSLTDTLGLVMLEANACGVPVATFPTQASETVIVDGENGAISNDLKEACERALTLSRETAREYALKMGWKEPTDMFLNNLTT